MILSVVIFGRHLEAGPSDAPGWDAKAAATYLDGRAEWWTTWPNAARDRGTYCMSCHTTLPYALARPALRGPLGEREPSAAEQKIFGNLLTRARNWREVEPWYPDQTRGIPKTSESRAIEAVMNALLIVRRDASTTGQLSDDGRTALGVMWNLQMKTGPNSGAWTWLNFNYEPWESPNSPYFGASLAALAVGSAPGGYAAAPEIQDNLKALRGYFAREHGKVALLNQLMALWAGGSIPDLLTDEQRRATIDATFALQQPDGGWSTTSLGSYKRVDNTANDTRTDGYATGLATLGVAGGRCRRLRPATRQRPGVASPQSGSRHRPVGGCVAEQGTRSRIRYRQVHERRRHGLRGHGADLREVAASRGASSTAVVQGQPAAPSCSTRPSEPAEASGFAGLITRSRTSVRVVPHAFSGVLAAARPVVELRTAGPGGHVVLSPRHARRRLGADTGPDRRLFVGHVGVVARRRQVRER